MARYIELDPLVAEIEKRIKETESMQPKFDQFWAGQISAFKGVLKMLNTLEVKEIDLEKETKKWWKEHLHLNPENKLWMDAPQSVVFAKHFFELGMQAQSDEKLVEEIYSHLDSIKDTADRMTSGNFMHNRGAIKFSANTIAKVLELMGLKIKKEE